MTEIKRSGFWQNGHRRIQRSPEGLSCARSPRVLETKIPNLIEFSIDPNISTLRTAELEIPMPTLPSETASLNSGISPAAPPSLLSVQQLCAKLGVSSDWVYERTKPDAPDPLPVVRLGTRLRFDPDQVFPYIRSREHHRVSARLDSSDGSVRVNGKEHWHMTRNRIQIGTVRLREDGNPSYWEGFIGRMWSPRQGRGTATPFGQPGLDERTLREGRPAKAGRHS
ncbi:MAG: hypothetical protein JWQ42_432 [Edaphobacter sp.]|nr:hypothetical protein [Edaphobacter sp.]